MLFEKMADDEIVAETVPAHDNGRYLVDHAVVY